MLSVVPGMPARTSAGQYSVWARVGRLRSGGQSAACADLPPAGGLTATAASPAWTRQNSVPGCSWP